MQNSIFLLATIAAALTACRTPGALPEPGAPFSSAPLASAAASSPPAALAGTELVHALYEAIRAGDAKADPLARALKQQAPTPCESYVREGSSEDGVLVSERAEVRVDTSGRLLGYELYDACLVGAAGPWRVFPGDSETSPRFGLGPHPTSIATLSAPLDRVRGTAHWLGLEAGGHTRFQRTGRPDSVTVSWGKCSGGEMGNDACMVEWGEQLALRSDHAVELIGRAGVREQLALPRAWKEGPDNTRVADLRGWRGRLVVLLHHDARTLVQIYARDARGRPVRRSSIDLGHATCGLATAVPCPFWITEIQAGLMILRSMRQDTAIVDLERGTPLDVARPTGRSAYQHTELEFCPLGVCGTVARYTSNEQTWVYKRQGRRLVPVSKVEVPHEPEDAATTTDTATGWTVCEGLPLPERICSLVAGLEP